MNRSWDNIFHEREIVEIYSFFTGQDLGADFSRIAFIAQIRPSRYPCPIAIRFELTKKCEALTVSKISKFEFILDDTMSLLCWCECANHSVTCSLERPEHFKLKTKYNHCLKVLFWIFQREIRMVCLNDIVRSYWEFWTTVPSGGRNRCLNGMLFSGKILVYFSTPTWLHTTQLPRGQTINERSARLNEHTAVRSLCMGNSEETNFFKWQKSSHEAVNGMRFSGNLKLVRGHSERS